MRRLFAGAATILAVTVLLLSFGAGPASAHGDTGAFSATQATPADDGTVTVDVLLTYDDGDGVEGATVTVTVQGPTGGPVPVTMSPGDRAGAYTGTFTPEAGGDYTLTATSTEPPATATFSVTAPDTATTTEAPATTTTDEPAATTTTAAAADDEDDSTSVGTIVANTVLLLIGAAAAFFGIRWWRNRRDAA